MSATEKKEVLTWLGKFSPVASAEETLLADTKKNLQVNPEPKYFEPSEPREIPLFKDELDKELDEVANKKGYESVEGMFDYNPELAKEYDNINYPTSDNQLQSEPEDNLNRLFNENPEFKYALDHVSPKPPEVDDGPAPSPEADNAPKTHGTDTNKAINNPLPQPNLNSESVACMGETPGQRNKRDSLSNFGKTNAENQESEKNTSQGSQDNNVLEDDSSAATKAPDWVMEAMTNNQNSITPAATT